jgi:hypothetical protein
MAKFDDLVEKVREVDEVLAEELEEFKGSSLRKKAEERDKFEAELQKARGELDRYVTQPKKEAALRDAGVDLEALRPAERKILEGLKADEYTAEWASKIADEYELPRGEASSELETSQAAAVAQAASRAPTGGRTGSTSTVTPEMVGEWSTEKMNRFAEANPEEWDALKRGETVAGVKIPV